MPAHDQYSVAELEEMVEVFPAGTIIALYNNKVVGVGIGIFISIDIYNLPATELDMLYTDNLSSHRDDGIYYYGSDIAVHPDYQRNGIGRAIYGKRKELIVSQNKRGFFAVAVLPGYQHHKHTLPIDDYLAKVIAGELYDPTLSVQLRNGFTALQPIQNFFTYPRSDNWGMIIYWENPDYTP